MLDYLDALDLVNEDGPYAAARAPLAGSAP
jgi:hypothetical protein